MKLSKWISFAVIAILMASCYPDKDRTIEDFDIVGTNYDSDIDFNSLNTYYLRDSIVLIYDIDDEKPEYPEKEAEVILDGIRANLNTLGWTEITDTTGVVPDVQLVPYVLTVKIEGVNYYPGWGYNPWYPGYYPPYGGGASYYSYTTGTILIDMWDLKNIDMAEETFNIVWSGAINGLVSSSNSSNLDRISYSINKAFEQSPYLKK